MSIAMDMPAWRSRAISLGGSMLFTGVLFVLVVPLSHWLAKEPETLPALQVETVELRPPPPPPEAEDKQEMPIAEELAAAPRPLGAPIELTALPTSAPARMGSPTGVLGIDNFNVEMGKLAEQTVFEVRDLDRVPQLISNPARVVPYELLRADIRGQVRLKILISPQGHVEVLDVISADHPKLIPAAEKFATKCRFEPPMRNNQPVATAFVFPITF